MPHRDRPTVRPTRTVLLLQGPASWFFLRLARALEARGARVVRVMFCPGDRLFWGLRRGLFFRGRAETFAPWLADRLAREGVTDLVCLGDGRRLHRDGIAVARRAGVDVHVLEQGYLRPGWLTVDRGGMADRSGLPRCPATLRALAVGRDWPNPPQYRAPFLHFAAMDVSWNLANLALGWAISPNYRRHGTVHPLREWAGWVMRAVSAPWTVRQTRRAMAVIAGWPGPVFLMPLQLDTDFAIRRDGTGQRMADVLADVIRSFADAAPSEALLIVKCHPLDHGLDGWGRAVVRLAMANGVSDRVCYLPGGRIEPLLPACSGVVTVNSTVGLTALVEGRPVSALGRAIYRINGMTDPRPLDAFFRAPRPPDPTLVRSFCLVLADTIQVPGGFDGTGAGPGAEGVARRILGPPLSDLAASAA